MKLRIAGVFVAFLSVVLSMTPQTSVGNSASVSVPPVIQFSNVATDEGGTTLSGTVSMTFSLYNSSQGGQALWSETQSVQLGSAGQYSVYLGLTQANGLPTNLFISGQAQWLGVKIEGQPEKPRVFLVSVPYAMKAGDAATIGGLPPSAFVMAVTPSGSGTAATATEASASGVTPATNPDVTGLGTVDYIPMWDSTSDIISSVLYQSGTGSSAKIGINTTTPASTLDIKGGSTVRGTLSLPATGTATASVGKSSQPIKQVASAYNSSSSMAVNQTFEWQAEPINNDTSTPSGTLNLLFGQGTAAPAQTGLSIAGNGQINFASGQTFPGTGDGTITGVTAGTDLTGGGTSGDVTLNLNTAALNSSYAQLAAANTFTGNQTVNGNLSATGMLSASGFEIGSNLFDWGSYANANAFLGFAGNTTATGGYNTAGGYAALQSITNGIENTAIGYTALQGNTAASANTAIGYGVLQSNGGTFNTAIGVQAMGSNSTGYQDTAIGAAALLANTTGYYNSATGLDALRFNTTGYANTASGYATLYSNTTACCNTAVGTQALVNSNVGGNNCNGGACANDAFGYQAMYNNTSGYQNEAFGYQAAYSNAGGANNSAFGYRALYTNAGGCPNTNGCLPYGFGNSAFGSGALFSNNCTSSCGGSSLPASLNSAFGSAALQANTTGSMNTAVGFDALDSNTTGSDNTAVGINALSTNTTGSDLTCIGVGCTASSNVTNATAIGAHALVEQSNSLVLGAVGVNVGIGTTSPSNILTIGRGLGHPVSDSWETYSSRRWKTNIKTLPDALSKVEQLRGVSYDLKDSGKHEIGVIAEEVGQVVPEIVSYEKNGKDAAGVDYSRLTALLIEAVKQQQQEIRDLKSKLRATHRTLQKVKAQVAAAQPALVAAK